MVPPNTRQCSWLGCPPTNPSPANPTIQVGSYTAGTRGGEQRSERTQDTGGHPWLPSATAQAPHGAGAQRGVAGVALERGRAADGEVLCRFQLSVCDNQDRTLDLCRAPKPRAFQGGSY